MDLIKKNTDSLQPKKGKEKQAIYKALNIVVINALCKDNGFSQWALAH